MKVVIVGELPFVEELNRLANDAGHQTVVFLPLDYASDDVANAELVIIANVFSSYLIDEVSESLPRDRPILFLALTESTTAASFAVSHPARVVGWGALPPIQPPDGEGLVEVARSLRTEDRYFEAALDFWWSLGLEPVEVADAPGLVRARMVCSLINEAVSALADGVANAEDIDAAMRLGNNYPKGLLAWADELGLDFVLQVLRGLHEESGNPAYAPNPLLKRMVWANHIGKEMGRGFFTY